MKQLKILFFFIIGTTFVSCSLEEDFVKNQKSITLQDIKTNHISYTDFSRKIQFVKNKPNFDYMISQNNMAKSIVDTTDYVIYTDKITELVYNDYTSYTMLLKTPNSTKNVYYNIIFEIQNQNTTVFIVKYTKSDSGILEENITSFRASEDFTGGGSNLLQMYIDDFENGGVGGSIGTPTSTGSGGIYWTGLGGSPIYPSNCNGTVSTTYVLEPHACYSGNHMPGQSCEYLNPSYQYYDPNKGPYYDLVPYYTCIENTTGENNSSPYDTGNTTGGNNTIPDDGDDELNGGTGNNSLTGIVAPIDEEKTTPCEELAKNDSIVDFNEKMEELKIKAGTQNFESAYAIYQNAVDGLIFSNEFTGKSNANGEGREVYLSLNTSAFANSINSIGFIHCHLDDGTTFKVFSLDDIIALALIAETSTRPTSEFAIYVTTNSGTLALKVNNKTLLTSKIDMMDLTYNKQEEEFRKYIKMNKTYDKQKLGLVKFLNNMPLIGNPGIDVYEKVGSTWNKLDLSTNGNSITSTPCN